MGQLTQTFDEVQEQMDGVYAEIYIDSETPTAQSIPTGTTLTVINGFANDGANGSSKQRNG